MKRVYECCDYIWSRPCYTLTEGQAVAIGVKASLQLLARIIYTTKRNSDVTDADMLNIQTSKFLSIPMSNTFVKNSILAVLCPNPCAPNCIRRVLRARNLHNDHCATLGVLMQVSTDFQHQRHHARPLAMRN